MRGGRAWRRRSTGKPRETGNGTRETSAPSRFPFLLSRFPLQVLPPLHALLDVLFEAEFGRIVPFLPAERLRQVLLRHVPVPELVGVLIPRPIAQVLHELGGRVADV